MCPIHSARFVVSAHTPADFPNDERPELAFAGRSNVGKSSLLNRLLGRKALARISSTPGRTRAVNYFEIDERYYFVDLPGYGWARAAKSDRRAWAELVESYLLEAVARGGAVVQLVDAKVGATDLDVQALDYLLALGFAPLVVATKVDRLPRSRRHAGLGEIRRRLALAEEELHPVSARTGEGVKALWGRIVRQLDALALSTE